MCSGFDRWRILSGLMPRSLACRSEERRVGKECIAGGGANLERELINFMLGLHTRVHVYTEISPPFLCFFFSSRRRHTRWTGDWSSDVCSSDLPSKTTSTHEGYSLAELALTLFYLDVFGFRSLEDFKRAYAEEFGVQIGRASCRERVYCWGGCESREGADQFYARPSHTRACLYRNQPAISLLFFFKQKTAYEMDG